jgi:hypothetical protein
MKITQIPRQKTRPSVCAEKREKEEEKHRQQYFLPPITPARPPKCVPSVVLVVIHI